MPKTSVENVKEQLRDKGAEVDDEEFAEQVEEYKERFGEFGDEEFAAFAVADQEYDVRIDSDYVLNSGSGTPPEEYEEYTIRDIRSGEVDDEENESFILEGLVISYWEGESDDGKPRRNIRLVDGTGSIRCMASGKESTRNFNGSVVEVGNTIRIEGAQVFYDPADSEEESDFYMIMLGQYCDYEMSDEVDVDDISDDVFLDPVSEGDFVKVEGVVSDHTRNGWEGCEECRTKYDTDEYPVCPECGVEGLQEWAFDTLNVKGQGESPMEVSVPPDIDVPLDDPIYNEVVVYGTYEVDEDDGTEYPQVSVPDVQFLTFPDSDAEMPSTEDESSEEESETGEETESEEPSTEEDIDTDDDYDYTGMAEDIEEQVKDFGNEFPATSPMKIVKNKYGVEDEGVIEKVFQLVHSRREVEFTTDVDGEEERIEDSSRIEDIEWEHIYVSPA